MPNMKKRCVIVGAAEINNYDRIRTYLAGYDFYVFCDGGLKHREGLGVEPDLILGDFDSHENPMLDVETIVLPREKDDTDTFFAVKEAVKRGFEDFLLVGVFGQRLDHTFGNISILIYLEKLGKKALAVDDYGEFEVVTGKETGFDSSDARDSNFSNKKINDSTLYIDDRFSYFSLMSLAGDAKGVSIKNAKYTLSGAVISCGYQYGISNEVIPCSTAEVNLKDGTLLLMRVF